MGKPDLLRLPQQIKNALTSRWLKKQIEESPRKSPKELSACLAAIYIIIDEWDIFVGRVGKEGESYAKLMQEGSSGSSGLFSLKGTREAPQLKEGLLFRGSVYERVMLAKGE